MAAEFFTGIGKIPFEGPDSTNPLAFRYYEPNRKVMGKRMEDHLRCAVAYWHTFASPGADMFGVGTFDRPWFDPAGDPMKMAELKMDAAFEFFVKLGAPFFCFHDRDIAPEGNTLAESNQFVDRMADYAQKKMDETGIKLLWGTANLFSNPRYMSGASTNPDPEVFAYAAAQVTHCLGVTQRLGGSSYVLWGGREGYETLLNTDLKREYEQLGRFLTMVVEHKHKIGFKGQLLIEPKPCEPTKHQYDFDTANVLALLQKFGLHNEIKVNLEANHATLAGHSFHHEVAYAVANGILGSIDMNRGDMLLGWDTDQFPNDVGEITLIMIELLRMGGFKEGGFNFDAKIRRQSIDPEDLFHAHIGGMDVMAHGLLNAAAIVEDGTLQKFVDYRYAGWDSGVGKEILAGKQSLESLAKLVEDKTINPKPRSGRQEMLENLINRFM